MDTKYITMQDETAVIQVEGHYNFLHIRPVEEALQLILSVYHPKRICVDFSKTQNMTASAWRSLEKIRGVVGEDNFECIHANEAVRYLLSVLDSESWLTKKTEVEYGREEGYKVF